MSETPSIPPSLEDRLSHSCFPQPENKSVKVWRYMDLAKFIWLLKEKKLFLSRLDRLGDPYEGSHTVKTIEGIEAFLRQHKAKDEWTELSEMYRRDRSQTYVSCWHANEHESEAMWRLYSPHGNGIAIQSTYGDLVRSIENEHEVYVGCIRYIDYQRQWFPDANTYQAVMHKRIAFAHEREVRLVSRPSKPQPSLEKETPTSISIQWDPSIWVQRIYVDPYAPEYFFEAVTTTIKYLMPCIQSHVVWSQMRELPKF